MWKYHGSLWFSRGKFGLGFINHGDRIPETQLVSKNFSHHQLMIVG
jgi:hypothetical protein